MPLTNIFFTMFSNPKHILGFDDRLLALTCIVINTHSVMAIYYTGAFFNTGFAAYATKWLGEFMAVALLWIVIRWLYLKLLKKRSGLKNIKSRLLIIPFFLIPYFLISIWFIEYVQPYFDWSYQQYQDPEASVQITTGAVIFFIDMGLYEALHLFVELKDTKIREEKLKKENLTTQLANLRNQISPHFLFNSLSTLVYLIDEDKEKSKEFVHKLSYIYKTVLDSSKKDLVSIREELEYINAYTGLLKKRFGQNLMFNFNIPRKDLDKKIMAFSLQLGIENAVKHNVVSKKQQLNIEIETMDGFLIIRNNLQKREVTDINGGLGLINISNRYHLITKKEVLIDNSGDFFTLKLPLLEA